MIPEARSDASGLAPTADCRALTETAHRHLAVLFPLDDLRARFDGRGGGSDIWSRLVEHGYTSVGLPQAIGGVGTLSELAAVLEEAGRALAPAPLVSAAAAAQTLLAADQHTDDLATLPRTIAVGARGHDEVMVLDATEAEEVVVVSAEDHTVTVNRYTLKPPDGTDPIDPSRPLTRIPLEPERLVHTGSVADYPIDRLLAPARVCFAADILGVAALALDGAVAHAQVRRQFGRPIGSFQAIKHLLADVYVEIERARSLIAGSASSIVRKADDTTATRLSLLAKAAASEAALHATAVQIEVFGALGLTFESNAPFALRRAQQVSRYLGAPADLYAAVAASRLADRRVR